MLTGLLSSERKRTALVLMGGGARTAYQAGVLQALADMRGLQTAAVQRFPFQVLVGTSAGALNVAFLAARAGHGLIALQELAYFWMQLRSTQVYKLDVSMAARWSKYLAAWSLTRNAMAHGAVLDNTPLVDTLHRAISLTGIEAALQSHAIDALAVTASSYTSGVHWTFCQTRPAAIVTPWQRPGRRADFQPITIEHLMASSALPLLFPPTPLWVDQGAEYFGDGSMRQIAPLSPAVHLGAQKILVVGVGQPLRTAWTGRTQEPGKSVLSRKPGLGTMAGHALASVFHDTLLADVEQLQRVNQTLQRLPPEAARLLPFKPVEVLVIAPSASLDALAMAHMHSLPRHTQQALGGRLKLQSGGAGFGARQGSCRLI